MQSERDSESDERKHFALVHGGCHGAWCWFKLKPLLESNGHKVTALDLAASGVNPREYTDIHTFRDYSAPLMEFLASYPSTQKVVLVGHSFGGLSIALAADEYPEKVSVAVFLTALLPDTIHTPSYVIQQDVELAKLLIRPCSVFIGNLSKAKRFTNEGYGSVEKVYIVCNEDKLVPQEFQHWMIENFGKKIKVKELQNADHMPMLSVPNQLCQCLLEEIHR